MKALLVTIVAVSLCAGPVRRGGRIGSNDKLDG